MSKVNASRELRKLISGFFYYRFGVSLVDFWLGAEGGT